MCALNVVSISSLLHVVYVPKRSHFCQLSLDRGEIFYCVKTFIAPLHKPLPSCTMSEKYDQT